MQELLENEAWKLAMEWLMATFAGAGVAWTAKLMFHFGSWIFFRRKKGGTLGEPLVTRLRSVFSRPEQINDFAGMTIDGDYATIIRLIDPDAARLCRGGEVKKYSITLKKQRSMWTLWLFKKVVLSSVQVRLPADDAGGRCERITSLVEGEDYCQRHDGKAIVEIALSAMKQYDLRVSAAVAESERMAKAERQKLAGIVPLA